MTVLEFLLPAILLGGIGTLAGALALIVSDPLKTNLRAAGNEAAGDGLAFSRIGRFVVPPLRSWTAGDGRSLGFRRWDSVAAGAPLVVAIHGSGWHGAQFAGLGTALAAAGLADVIAPDLRGHGPSPERRGDVDYIGQMEDDLAELIEAQAAPGQQVVMLGHSSGGGMVIRFAGGRHGNLLDGAILLAPYLHHRAPTMRPAAGGWNDVRLRRIIGLTILNAFGIKVLNHLKVLQFRFPPWVLDGPLGHTATPAYSYRLMTGFNPRNDWKADVGRLPPFLLVAGEDDEAFVAQAYEPAMRPSNPNGQYVLLPKVGHLDVVDAPATFEVLEDRLRGLTLVARSDPKGTSSRSIPS